MYVSSKGSDETALLHSLVWAFAAHFYNSKKKKKTFCGFSIGRNQYWAGRVYDLCVYYMTGTPEGSTESGFMEKPGIQPATPGLQGIALIHYTTGLLKFKTSIILNFLKSNLKLAVWLQISTLFQV